MGNTGKPTHDLTGQRFGQLTILEWVPNYRQITKSDGRIVWNGGWKCRCDCGNDVMKRTNAINAKFARSCGCAVKLKREFPMIGKRFGKLLVKEQRQSIRYVYENRRAGHQRTWLCECDCGNTKVLSTNALTQDRKTHCGCSPKPKTMNSLRAGLAKRRVEIRSEVYDRMVRGLQEGGLTLITTFEEARAVKQISTMKVKIRCEALGHETRVGWMRIHFDKECRICRRDRKNKAIRDGNALAKVQAKAERERLRALEIAEREELKRKKLAERETRIAASIGLREWNLAQSKKRAMEREALKARAIQARKDRQTFREARKGAQSGAESYGSRFRKRKWESELGLGLPTGANWSEIRKRINKPSTT